MDIKFDCREIVNFRKEWLSSVGYTNDEQKSLDDIREGLKYDPKIKTINKDNLEQI